MTEDNQDEIIQTLYELIDQLLEDIGVPHPDHYYVKERVGRLIKNRSELHVKGQELATYCLSIFERFEAWGERTNRTFEFTGDHFIYVILFEWLCQESNAHGLAGYGSTPDFLYYLFNLTLKSYFSQGKETFPKEQIYQKFVSI